jgi:hypothetical protein
VNVPEQTTSPAVRAYLDKTLAQTEAEQQAEHVLYEKRLRQEKRAARWRGLRQLAIVVGVLSVGLFLYDHVDFGPILLVWVPIGLLFLAQHFDLGATYK